MVTISRCGCISGCNCSIVPLETDTATVTITGSGSAANSDPYIISVDVTGGGGGDTHDGAGAGSTFIELTVNSPSATGAGSIAMGQLALASGISSVAVGSSAQSTHNNSVALGVSATTTAINQIRLGTATEDVNIPGTLTLSGGSVTPGVWIAYTPTLVQSGAVTKTVNSAQYSRVGKTIHFQVHLTCTGAGTAANNVLIGLPVTAAYNTNRMCGAGFIFDSSATLTYKGLALLATTTAVALLPTNTTTNGFLGADTFTAALASPDQICVTGTYEAA